MISESYNTLLNEFTIESCHIEDMVLLVSEELVQGRLRLPMSPFCSPPVPRSSRSCHPSGHGLPVSPSGPPGRSSVRRAVAALMPGISWYAHAADPLQTSCRPLGGVYPLADQGVEPRAT
ncbi:hypothetical protein SKAU_G00189370 [Synaphobranchus kaupii]|uniref:Uncharacterized protein n=1 Tax=Synaphobranchus kaupii TaxID=118154 RepID=A0A9Q1FDR6_SYNKA|nr:hypothetical protein SKAU_G00189370 [Synaphobranchus kaupii]